MHSQVKQRCATATGDNETTSGSERTKNKKMKSAFWHVGNKECAVVSERASDRECKWARVIEKAKGKGEKVEG